MKGLKYGNISGFSRVGAGSKAKVSSKRIWHLCGSFSWVYMGIQCKVPAIWVSWLNPASWIMLEKNSLLSVLWCLLLKSHALGNLILSPSHLLVYNTLLHSSLAGSSWEQKIWHESPLLFFWGYFQTIRTYCYFCLSFCIHQLENKKFRFFFVD